MNQRKATSGPFYELRKRVDAVLGAEGEVVQDLSADEVRELIHELRTHQIELEMQNTELRRAQEELAESRDQYSDLYDFAPIGYVSLSEEGLIFRANLTFAEMLGVERANLIKHPFSALVVEDNQHIYYRHRRRLLETKEQQTFGLRMRKRGAAPFWAGIVLSITTTPDTIDEFPIRMAVSDVTERMRAEAQLRESQDRYQRVTEGTKGIVYSLLLGHGGEYCSPNVAEILGYRDSWLLDRPMLWHDSIHPDDVIAVDEVLVALQLGHAHELEYRVARSSGEWVWLRDRFCARHDEQGNTVVDGVAVDVTEIKQAELTAQTANRFLAIAAHCTGMPSLLREFVEEIRDVTGCAAVGLRILDSEGNIPYQAYEGFSREFYELESPLSIKSDQCMCISVIKRNTDPTRVWFTESGSFYSNGTTRLLATVSEEEKGETRNICNQSRYESVALVPICTRDRVLGLIHVADPEENMVPLWLVELLEAVARQLSVVLLRAQAEEGLRRLNEDLEARVEKRTTILRRTVTELKDEVARRQQFEKALRESHHHLQVTLDELKKTQEQIVRQERLRALGEMASGVAHDLNNSLTPIVGFSDLLLSDPALPEKAHEHAQWINRAARDAAASVARLRDFYRPQTSLESQTSVSLKELIPEVVGLTRPKWSDEARRTGRTIQLDLELDDAPPVCGNATQIQEVLTNLVFNAADALPSGGRIVLRLRGTPDSALVEVADTGIGMPEEVRRKCVEPFFTTKGPQGTGLGLSVCHGIVERHGGRLEVDSNVGQGTTVRIYWPLASEDASEKPAKTGEAALPKGRVLYIDDDPRVRKVVKAMLEQLGQHVHVAEGGAEGLEMLQTNRYDVVITDLGMPDVDGTIVTRAVKFAYPELPVVLLTGWESDVETAKMTKTVSADCILGKPVTISQLQETLAELLR